MKTKTFLKTFSVGLVITLLAACGKQSSNSSGSTRSNRPNYSGVSALQAGTSTCGGTTGRIYNQNTNDADFRQTVANFTLYNVDEIGNISPLYGSSTGIEFTMTLAFSGGNLTNGSKAGFKITDSYVGQPSTDGSTVKPIEFMMSGLQGQGYNGQFNAVVGDSKGSVRFQGYRTTSSGQSVVAGQVFFTNNNGSGEAYLGDFVISACAVTGI